MNMIEKVARTINNNSIIKHSETIDEWRMRQAKAAIAEMREPTLVMVESVGSSWGSALHYDYMKMIDAALKEE